MVEKHVQSFDIKTELKPTIWLEFDIIPLRENNDGVIAIGGTSLADNPSLCPIQIKMREEGSFGILNYKESISSATIKYFINERYNIRLSIHKNTKTYDVWITPPNLRPIHIGRDYLFNIDAPKKMIVDKMFLLMEQKDDFRVENIKVCSKDYLYGDNVSAAQTPSIYYVGPTREFKELQDIENRLNPGDTVLVDGDFTYNGGIVFPHHGTIDDFITVKGVKVNGKRPLIDGGTDNLYAVELSGHNFIFEGFEITGAKKCGICHHADNVIIRDCVIHDCDMGILSDQDIGMGNVLVEHCEVYNCGSDMYKHQLYMATDEIRHPGSVFRLQYCYIHDGTGGNNVKSRAERNEIYYNWLENPYYHNMELIGPDPDYNPIKEDMAREDSDIVGNVMISSRWYQTRLGGDGTGQSNGRYRFVNNTFICNYQSDEYVPFRIMFGIESIEMHNNIFYNLNDNIAPLYYEDRAKWTQEQRVIYGSFNWIQKGCTPLEGWTETRVGIDPGFVDATKYDFRLEENSPLICGGTSATKSPAGHDFPNPLNIPLYLPPMRALLNSRKAIERVVEDNKPSIGAYERQKI